MNDPEIGIKTEFLISDVKILVNEFLEFKVEMKEYLN